MLTGKTIEPSSGEDRVLEWGSIMLQDIHTEKEACCTGCMDQGTGVRHRRDSEHPPIGKMIQRMERFLEKIGTKKIAELIAEEGSIAQTFDLLSDALLRRIDAERRNPISWISSLAIK